MDSIDVFYNSEIILKRKKFEIKYYIIFMFLFIGILLLFIGFFKYTPYINLKAILKIEDNDYYLKTFIQEENFNYINQLSLIINNKSYKYRIKHINDGYILDEKYNKYYEGLRKDKGMIKFIVYLISKFRIYFI